MPDSRPERIIFSFGVAAIAALVVALIPAYRSYTRTAPANAAPTQTVGVAGAEKTVTQTPATPVKRTVSPPARNRGSVSGGKVQAAKKPALAFSAARGDCWLEARSGSSKGKVLYAGTLAKGKSLRLAGEKLWVRFGAPQNVDLRVNGELAAIPSGTLDVVVTGSGARAA